MADAETILLHNSKLAKPSRGRKKAGWLLSLCIACGWITPSHAGLSDCNFHFGTAFSGAIAADLIPQIDYVTQWAGYTEAYNLGGMMRYCSPGGRFEGKTPVIYSYIIAFTLRNKFGLLDCNVGNPNLCESGAARLRESQVRQSIVQVYSNYAQGTANDWGTQKPVVWLMEPDFYQYAQPGSQGGNPLSFNEASTLMNELIDAVKKHLPNAVFSLDISPWTTDQGQTQAYYQAFDLNRFTYMHTSGGESRANSSNITNNRMTYREIFDLTKKPIIADCGYGVGGDATVHNNEWDNVQNINNRIADGVIAITQANPKADWANTLKSNAPQLNEPGLCPVSLWTHREGNASPGSKKVSGQLRTLSNAPIWLTLPAARFPRDGKGSAKDQPRLLFPNGAARPHSALP